VHGGRNCLHEFKRAELIHSFLPPRSPRISIARWTRRRADDHTVPRSNPGNYFFQFFTFLFFHGTPLACESSHEHSTSIFIGRGFVRGGCIFSRNMFSRNMFSPNMFSRNMELFSFGGMELYKKELLTKKLFISFSERGAISTGCDFHTHGSAWY
jgi:hypothetical protein